MNEVQTDYVHLLEQREREREREGERDGERISRSKQGAGWPFTVMNQLAQQ